MSKRSARQLQYIENAGGSVSVAQFDEDWSPAGPLFRQAMVDRGTVIEEAGVIFVAKDELIIEGGGRRGKYDLTAKISPLAKH